eukprot:EG_transcript_23835
MNESTVNGPGSQHLWGPNEQWYALDSNDPYTARCGFRDDLVHQHCQPCEDEDDESLNQRKHMDSTKQKLRWQVNQILQHNAFSTQCTPQQPHSSLPSTIPCPSSAYLRFPAVHGIFLPPQVPCFA